MDHHQRLPLLIVCLLLLPGTAPGQINIERMRALDMEGFRSTLGADVAVESRHTKLFEIEARAQFEHFCDGGVALRHAERGPLPGPRVRAPAL